MANLTKEQRLAREAEKQAQIEKEIELKKQYDADTLEKYSKDFLIDFCKQALEFLNARYEYFLPLKQQKLEELRRKRNKINEFERG